MPSARAAVSMASTSSAMPACTVKPWTVRSGGAGVDGRGALVVGGRVVVVVLGGRVVVVGAGGAPGAGAAVVGGAVGGAATSGADGVSGTATSGSGGGGRRAIRAA